MSSSDPAADTPAPPQWAVTAAERLAAEDKRQRTPPVDRGLAHSDGLVHVQLASPSGRAAPACMPPRPPSHEREQRPGPGQAPHAAAHTQQHGSAAPHPGVVRQQAHEEAELFSPLFHLHKEGSHADLCAAGASTAAEEEAQPLTQLPTQPLPSQPPPGLAQPGRSDTDNTSTDHSTGTSASLSMAADADACGDVASVECAMAPPAQQAQQQAEEVDDECLDFDPLLFIKRLPPLERCVPPRHDFLLPKKTRRSKQKT